jgi:hypothetical protein
MFSSVGPGAGKTTLSRHLASGLEKRGDTVRYFADSVLFEEPALEDLARAFRTRRFPGPGQLLDGLAALLHLAGNPDWIILETNWMLGGEDLPWGQRSWQAIVSYTRDLMRVAADYDPTVMHLELDLAESLRRAEQRDGEEGFGRWLHYMRSLPALQEKRDADPLTLIAASGERIRRIWADAGVDLVHLDATGSREAVLARAVSALDERYASHQARRQRPDRPSTT